jgi:hypothetical protein
MRKLLLAVSLLGLTASGGCASAQAKAADRPALAVPPPPARVIEPAEIAAEPVPELPGPPSGAPANSAAPRSSRPASPKPAAGETKPADPKPADPVPPPVEPPPPAVPPAQLRTPQTADPNGAARAVRTTLDTARGLLNTVDFGAQSNERKKAYNDAKLFMQQAEDALKEGNLGLAQGIASKAETLARELAGR